MASRILWAGLMTIFLCIETVIGMETTKEGIFNDYYYFLPWDDYYHFPEQLKYYPEYEVPPILPKTVNGTEYTVLEPREAPDFRQPEQPYILYYNYSYTGRLCQEQNRYCRITPRINMNWYWWEREELVRCYCVTVFKRLTSLGMGAILTARHLLTTAMSTDIVVNKYKHKLTLENILGAWYEAYGIDAVNQTVYMTPARIHYHPRWNPPEQTNRSHPLPCVFDLAVWASKRNFYGNVFSWWTGTYVAYCQRCSGRGKAGWTAPGYKYDDEMTLMIGTQMVMDQGRKPFPWFKYAVKTEVGKLYVCPKTEWGWFMCLEMRGMHPKLGVDVGSPLHISYHNRGHRWDGLAGINSFSMRLRSFQFVNYYTILDRHPVLDFLYATYTGRLPYAYLDIRFNNTQYGAPVPKEREAINYTKELGIDWSLKYYYTPIWWR